MTHAIIIELPVIILLWLILVQLRALTRTLIRLGDYLVRRFK